jgi:hypothetical protein
VAALRLCTKAVLVVPLLTMTAAFFYHVGFAILKTHALRMAALRATRNDRSKRR